MTVLKEFEDATPLKNPWIDSWKEEGKKVLGYFCSYIPDEIIHAADILPIRMRATGCTDTPMGDAYLTPTACSYTRCCLEMANRKQYDFLDGAISCNSCDQIRRLFDNIRIKTPFPYHYFLGVPGNINELTIDWYKHELTKFKASLEEKFGIEISNEKLRSSIKTYNESRTLLKELYMLRKKPKPPISGTDTMKILLTDVSIPREQFNELLRRQLKELDGKEGISNHKSRLMVVGSPIDDPEYLKIIEDLGGLIVMDSFCLGTRNFWEQVDETKDPIEALAEYYMTRVTCPRMSGKQSDRVEFVADLVKEFNVNGVILQRMKFCALWWAEIFIIRKKLKELGVPFLDLEREYVSSGVGSMKTRVQGFMEILEER